MSDNYMEKYKHGEDSRVPGRDDFKCQFGQATAPSCLVRHPLDVVVNMFVRCDLLYNLKTLSKPDDLP